MPCSMTGFARREAQHSWGALACEIRSVNHRYLEPSMRMPDTLRSIEPKLRDALRKKLSRGKVEISLQLRVETAEGNDLALNTALASTVASMAESVQATLSNPGPLNAMDILKWPGVIKTADVDTDEVSSAALTLFNEALQQLIENRSREGKELKSFIEQRLDSIGESVIALRARLPEILEQHQQKLRSKIDALGVEVDEERFNQEVVYIAQKADVAEELDRLEAHLTEVRHTLKQKGPLGRRLDFLMQELNREANTLSSKSMASDTSQSAVDLKVLIEQMREQVQNIE